MNLLKFRGLMLELGAFRRDSVDRTGTLLSFLPDAGAFPFDLFGVGFHALMPLESCKRASTRVSAQSALCHHVGLIGVLTVSPQELGRQIQFSSAYVPMSDIRGATAIDAV